jgi:hypothetical protein
MILQNNIYLNKTQIRKVGDIKGVIRSRKWQNIQYDGQNKEGQPMIYITPHRKLYIEPNKSNYKTVVNTVE